MIRRMTALLTSARAGAAPRTPQAASRTPEPPGYAGVPIVEVATDAGPLWLQADDGVMLPYLRKNGTWESDEGRILLRHARPGSVVVDVGANVGYFSRLLATAARPSVVHAFEPHPDLAGILRLNTWGLAAPVVVHPLALGQRHGTVSITSADHNIGDSRVSEHPSGAATRVAAMAPLDEVINGRVDLVKIDVQGYESDVVAGMVRIIRENPSIVIVSEFWPSAIRGRDLSPTTVLRQYEAQGLTIRVLRNGSVVPMTHDEILRFCASAGPEGQANLLLTGPQAGLAG